MSDIKDITKWDREPGSNSPTYAIPVDDLEYDSQVYQRAATAVYTKLAYADFSKLPSLEIK